jgi:pimeloyl-ACP methyl ester carboxylesterase
VVQGLHDADVPVVAVDLPGQGNDPDPILDLHGDAQRVRDVLATVDGPVVLVGHSYGGAVITEAGTGSNVERLVFIAAYALTEDETVRTAGSADPRVASLDHSGRPVLREGFRVSEDGTTVRIEPEHAKLCFYSDCSPLDQAWAATRLGDQSLTAFSQSPTVVAWRQIPSYYVVCANDLALHPGLQRILAERGTESVEWPTGHSPFLSQPSLVVDLIGDLAARDTTTH